MEDSKNKFTELSKIKKDNPFQVPKHYFDDFPARLQAKIDAENVEEPKHENRFIHYLKPALSLAAGFALIFLLVQWPLKTFVPNTQTASQTSDMELSDMDYETMVEGIDENSFYALLDDTNGKDDFTDEEIVSYLQANSSDYELFAETIK
jgi:hypothetical protein